MNLKNKALLLLFMCFSVISFIFKTAAAALERYDLIIRGATIVDGTGGKSFRGDIAITGERIAGIGRIRGKAETVIDASGLVASPGFIDPHSHADASILKYPLAENLVMQGITTFVGGNCGLSLAPRTDKFFVWQDFGIKESDAGFTLDWESFGEYLSTLEETRSALNFVPLIGHGAVRYCVMGNDFRRTANADETAAMERLVGEAMRSGAFGLSTGLDYLPGHFANTEEIVALARIVRQFGGIYVTHARFNNSDWPTDDPEKVSYGRYLGTPENIWIGLYKGVAEAIEIGKIAGIPVQISHIANIFRIPQPHPEFLDKSAAEATLWVLDEAHKEGVDVTFDVIATADSIASQSKLIDAFYSKRVQGLHWVQDFNREEFIRRLKTEEFRKRLRRVHESGQLKLGMVHTLVDPYWHNCFRIISCADKQCEGKILGDIAGERGRDPLETLFDILTEDPETTWVQFLDRRGTDIMNAVFLKHPAAMPCTDTEALPAKSEPGRSPAPVAFGLYPHYFGHYIRDMSL
ncbi:MAG: amidohydrolase family protein, partial [Candidatus Aminicenantes bacterium]|nr:amidohydrolase family protein [Candidatus Aminicenantes bacterium]